MLIQKEYRVVIQTVDVVWQGWVWRLLGIPVARRADCLAEYRHGALYWRDKEPPPGVRVRVVRV